MGKIKQKGSAGNYAQDVLFIMSVLMSFLLSTINYKVVNTETFTGCEQTLPNETTLSHIYFSE